MVLIGFTHYHTLKNVKIIHVVKTISPQNFDYFPEKSKQTVRVRISSHGPKPWAFISLKDKSSPQTTLSTIRLACWIGKSKIGEDISATTESWILSSWFTNYTVSKVLASLKTVFISSFTQD